MIFFMIKCFHLLPWMATVIPDPVWYSLSIIKHLIIICLIPVTIYFFKKGKPEKVKYIVVITYLVTNIVTDIYYYFGKADSYSSGNLVELVIILFSPIFINKRFFYLVTSGYNPKIYIGRSIHTRSCLYYFPLLSSAYWPLLLTFSFIEF